MGAKSCEKSLETFTFDNKSRDLEQKFANFLGCRRKLHGGKNTGSGFGKIMNCEGGTYVIFGKVEHRTSNKRIVRC